MRIRTLRLLKILPAVLLLSCAAACGAAAPRTQAPAATKAPAATSAPAVATRAPEPTAVQPATAGATESPAPTATMRLPVPTATPAALPATPQPTPVSEERIVELEWPAQMRLGDSDTIRLALIPSKGGYVVRAEFPEHQTESGGVDIARPGGYDLMASARLDAAGFDISPQGDQAQELPLDSTVTWRWTITPRTGGQHRVALILSLRWIPQSANAGPIRETEIFSRALTVGVNSMLGLTTLQAGIVGLAGMMLGGSLGLPLAWYFIRPRKKLLRELAPNPGLILEIPAGLELSASEQRLLRALFSRYARLTLEAEFRSGYSGARAFLALPVRGDGRADAYTIAKLGERTAIRREYENYLTFVKDTLPPITARIQEIPVALRSGQLRTAARGEPEIAALRYTFIGEPGRTPTSLRSGLLARPDPALLEKLFSTFGPNWWMQHRPFTFRLAEEYDRMLPAHYVIEPAAGTGKRILDGNLPPEDSAWKTGDVVRLRNLRAAERRPDGKSLSLVGRTLPGNPPLRVRWSSLAPPDGAVGRVAATRGELLREFVSGLDLCGLPDPLPRIPALLQERVMGTQSTIHGDLNLENILIGPGNFIWLIDFAQTRDGHPLFDFAHLEAEIIAHIVAPQTPSAREYLAVWRADGGSSPHRALLDAMHSIAGRCLFNPSQPREYRLALAVACLGALKFANLDAHRRQMLYLSAADLIRTL
jgi:hypothetical protein